MPRTIAYPPETLSQNEWFEYIYKQRNKPMINVKNICDYVTNKGIRASSPFICKPDGTKFYRYEGKEIPQEEFELMYPIELIPILAKGESPDRKNCFIHNAKSY